MDPAKQLKELEILVNRAKRAGLKVHHYPENNLVVIRVVPAPVDSKPAAPATPAPTPV